VWVSLSRISKGIKFFMSVGLSWVVTPCGLSGVFNVLEESFASIFGVEGDDYMVSGSVRPQSL
jgi:hypothetical protein